MPPHTEYVLEDEEGTEIGRLHDYGAVCSLMSSCGRVWVRLPKAVMQAETEADKSTVWALYSAMLEGRVRCSSTDKS